MDKLFESLPTGILALIAMVLIYIAKFLFHDFWNDRKEKIKIWEAMVQANTIAMTELKVELRHLTETFQGIVRKVENLEDDLDALHAQRRKESNPLK